MSSNSIRQRGASKEKSLSASPSQIGDGKINGTIDQTIDSLPKVVKSEWEYKVALTVITLVAFVTRFWGIGHPNEVVFDEVHFGKVPMLLANTPSRGVHRTTQPIANIGPDVLTLA